MIRKGFFNSYTGIIISINVIAFVLFSFALIFLKHIDPLEIYSYVAIQPAMILAGKNLWTIITHIFIHANLTHLFVNMISLMFIGSFVEKLIGKKRFLWTYFGGGIAAALLFIIVAGITGTDLNTFAVGASGAIFALGGLLAVLTPKLPVLVFFVLPLPMWAAMIFLLGVMWIISITAGVPIGNIAHLGGLILGVGYGFYLKNKYPHKTKMIARYFT
jgi:membrane associated rhomboid family serine protease